MTVNALKLVTVFDFKPVNTELLVLSRLDFIPKRQKIINYVKNLARERKADFDIVESQQNSWRTQWLK